MTGTVTLIPVVDLGKIMEVRTIKIHNIEAGKVEKPSPIVE